MIVGHATPFGLPREEAERAALGALDVAPDPVGYDWPGNMRELMHYTRRFVLTDGRMPGPAAVAAAEQGATEEQEAPPTTSAESSGYLGPKAKAGEVSPKEIERDVVTRIFVATGQNKTETARRAGYSWRKVDRMIDPVRLARLLRKASKKPGKTPEPGKAPKPRKAPKKPGKE